MVGVQRKQFKPFTTCRFLPGEVDDSSNLKDLFIYNCHRQRIFNMDTGIDDKPLRFNPYQCINKKKLRNDLITSTQIDKENKRLLKSINQINRNGGNIDTFNSFACRRNSNYWKFHEYKMNEITKVNNVIYKNLIKVTPTYKKSDYDKHAKITKTIKKELCRYNLVSMKKNYDTILSRQPSISQGLHIEDTSGRIYCFMEFKVRDGPYLGKIIIELYNDIVPVTCQNFMQICKGENDLTYKDCVLHRIVRGRFIETGDITHNTGRGGNSIYGKTFHEERHVLSHTKAGILSMKRISPGANNNSQFIITLNRLESYDKMNVVFGKIIKGNNVIFIIEEYGRQIGKPHADILISNCGVVEDTHQESKKKRKSTVVEEEVKVTTENETVDLLTVESN